MLLRDWSWSLVHPGLCRRTLSTPKVTVPEVSVHVAVYLGDDVNCYVAGRHVSRRWLDVEVSAEWQRIPSLLPAT